MSTLHLPSTVRRSRVALAAAAFAAALITVMALPGNTVQPATATIPAAAAYA